VTGHHQPDFKAAAQIRFDVHVYFNDPLWCVYRLRRHPPKSRGQGWLEEGLYLLASCLSRLDGGVFILFAYAMISQSMTISLFASIKAPKINKRAL
jgi:hypothetical protein